MYFLKDTSNETPYAHNLKEMAQIGVVGDWTIWIYNGEGPIPHFHFVNNQTHEEGCICLLENRYFSHGRKQAELNAKERKMLMRFLLSPMKRMNTNVYNYLCSSWETNNPSHPLPMNIRTPDYTEILPYK